MDIIFELEHRLGTPQMVELAKQLLGEYDLGQNDQQLWALVSRVFHDHIDLSDRTWKQLQQSTLANEFINSMVMEYFPGENVVKYHFIRNILNQQDVVCFFERNANSNRADLCLINGHSFAYEIKTEIDALDRLTRQIASYSTQFEYVYAILDVSHISKATNLIPEHCGIIEYQLDKGVCKFNYTRKATPSPNLDHLAQVHNLSSVDLQKILQWTNEDIPKAKRKRTELMLKTLSPAEINHYFKRVLWEKYNEQWSFLKANFDQIYPIDIQAFFRQPIAPEIVYFRA